MSKKINTRIQVKSDTAANWNTASNAPTPFVPLEGEFIFIKDGYEVKIGDGAKTVNALPYIPIIDDSVTFILHGGGSENTEVSIFTVTNDAGGETAII